MTKRRPPDDLIDEIRNAELGEQYGPPTDGGPMGLSAKAIELARAGEQVDLAEELQADGLPGRPLAELFVSAIQLERELQKVQSVGEAVRTLAAAERHRSCLREFRPTSAREAGELAEERHQADLAWTQALTARSAAERAELELGFLRSYFPDLFGVEPQMLKGEPVVIGARPESLRVWYEKYRIDPDVFNGWQRLGQLPESATRKRRRLVAR